MTLADLTVDIVPIVGSITSKRRNPSFFVIRARDAHIGHIVRNRPWGADG
jgi:hypothetical protein